MMMDNVGGGSGSSDPHHNQGGVGVFSDPQGRNKKRYHRHTTHQIQRLESTFNDCPHPDEKTRLQLSRELDLAPQQIKFWFQNRRTQIKVQHERADNFTLREENDKIRYENMAIREALKNVICPSCGGSPVGEGPCFDAEKLRMENAKLKQELDRISSIAKKGLGGPIPILSLDLPMSTHGPSLNDFDQLHASSSSTPIIKNPISGGGTMNMPPVQPIPMPDSSKSIHGVQDPDLFHASSSSTSTINEISGAGMMNMPPGQPISMPDLSMSTQGMLGPDLLHASSSSTPIIKNPISGGGTMNMPPVQHIPMPDSSMSIHGMLGPDLLHASSSSTSTINQISGAGMTNMPPVQPISMPDLSMSAHGMLGPDLLHASSSSTPTIIENPISGGGTMNMPPVQPIPMSDSSMSIHGMLGPDLLHASSSSTSTINQISGAGMTNMPPVQPISMPDLSMSSHGMLSPDLLHASSSSTPTIIKNPISGGGTMNMPLVQPIPMPDSSMSIHGMLGPDLLHASSSSTSTINQISGAGMTNMPPVQPISMPDISMSAHGMLGPDLLHASSSSTPTIIENPISGGGTMNMPLAQPIPMPDSSMSIHGMLGPDLLHASSSSTSTINQISGAAMINMPPVQPISMPDLSMSAHGMLGLDLLHASSSSTPTIIENPISGGGTMNISDDMIDVAGNAMNELIRLFQSNEPLWVKSSVDGKEFLNLEVYDTMFPRPNSWKNPNTRIESSRDSALVIMNSLALVDMFMDVNKWVELFPNIVSRATTLHVISSGMMGSQNGTLQLMYEELQVLSPFVLPRQLYFLRFCQQIEETCWAIVDVSYEIPLENQFDASSPSCKTYMFPSGCLIQDMPNGCSRVIWVEHLEMEENVGVHRLFRDLFQSGMAFGAKRWLATLERMCERNAFRELQGFIPPPEGKRNMMNLAHRLVTGFCASINPSNAIQWTLLSGLNEYDVRATLQISTDPGQPDGSVLSAATTVWLPNIPPQHVFNFLRDERTRPQWDVLSNQNPVQEVVHIANGSHPGNCISLLRALNTMQNTMLILQESCVDSSGSMVVFSPVDLPSINLAMSGEDPSYIHLLPSGFAISADGCNRKTESDQGASGSLLTVVLQISVGSLPSAKMTPESENTVNQLIDSTVRQIKVALNCTTPIFS